MPLRFTDETPDTTMFNDIKMLNAFSDEQFQSLMAHCLNFLCGSTSSQFLEDVGSFCEENKGALRANLTPSYISEDLLQLGLGEEKAAVVAALWKANFVAMSRASSDVTLMVNQLVDMQWRFGVTSSNSELFRAGSTFLQMKLVLDKGEKKEAVNMELSLSQFYEFVHEMEKAKSSLEMFSG